MLMSKSRLEKFLYALYSLDSSDLPNPISRIEELYKCWVTGEEAPTFEPLSRVEKYLMAILGAYDVESLPNPLSRVEVLLYKLATGDDNLDGFDTFLSKHEELLAEIIRNGGAGGNINIEYVLYTLSTEFNTLYNTAEKPVKSAILKGSSMVNLSTLNGEITIAPGSAQFVDSPLIKTSTIYTVSFNCSSVPSTGSIEVRQINGSTALKMDNITVTQGYNQFIVLTHGSEVTRFRLKNDSKSTTDFIFNDLMILEGDYRGVDIPYFEGINSVQMPVLTTTGKNLFDGEFKVSSYSSGKAYFPNNSMSSVSFPFTTSASLRGIASIIKVKPNTSYSFTISNQPEKCVMLGSGYENIDSISSVSNAVLTIGSVGNDTITTRSFTTTSNCNYMVIGCFAKYEQNTTNTITFNEAPNIQLEEGAVATEYEPHESTTLTCNEEVELRGIGEVKDELNCLTGELTQRIGEVVFDGSENWQIIYHNNNNMKRYSLNGITFPFNNYQEISNCFRTGKSFWNIDETGMYIGTNGKLVITFKSTDNRYNYTLNEFKNYLSENPIKLQYSNEESVKTVDLSVVDQDGNNTKLSTFDDITHVTLSSEGLIPEAELEVATKNEEDLGDSIVYTAYTLNEEHNTLYNTKEKPVKSAILKGNTLTNLSQSNGEITLTPNSVKFVIDGSTMIKSNTTYTVSFNCLSLPSTNFIEFSQAFDNTALKMENISVVQGHNKFKVTTDINKVNRFRLKNDTTSETDFVFNNIMIIEGDYTNIDIPYFEGMQSVKMPVLTTIGKNLINNSKNQVKDINSSSGNESPSNACVITDYIPYQYGTNNMVSLYVNGVKTNMVTWRAYDKDKNYQGTSANSNTAYIRLRYFKGSDVRSDEVLFQLERNSTVTSYEPHESTTLTCNEEVELRGIGDVKDELNLLTGELTQRVDKVVLDGSQQNISVNTSNVNTALIIFNSIKTGLSSNSVCICDKLPFKANSSEDFEHMRLNSSGQVCLWLNKTKFETLNEAGVNKYLLQNPIMIQYPLVTETTKTVDISTIDQDENNTKLNTFNDITHVTLSSEGLIPEAELEVAEKVTEVAASMLSISREQEVINTTTNEQSENVDSTMIATTEIYEGLL